MTKEFILDEIERLKQEYRKMEDEQVSYDPFFQEIWQTGIENRKSLIEYLRQHPNYTPTKPTQND